MGNVVVLVLFQIVIVIALSRLMGLACRQIKQPLVIGEIIAGIMLGPSLLGLVAPDLIGVLFPPATLPILNVLSQIGLIFFMFLIGLELNPDYLKGQLNIAILISHVSIVVPFLLGSGLALVLYPLVSDNAVSFTAFALFLGAAMSITAFPVLARIITENNLQKTRIGTLALTCAAVDDVTAWCLLALAIAVTRTNNVFGALPTIIESIIYIALMLTVGRWFLQKLVKHYNRTGKLTQLLLAVIYLWVVVSALITEFIGIHLIFGAFLVGAAMPKDQGLVKEIAEKTEDFVLIFLLPIFFAFSGLRTQIGLLNRPELWLLCALVIAVAIIGKYVGTYKAARVCGIEAREASALGWLMNTRGLTELIVLNIGLSLGVISPLLFTMLVIMALVTTFMTSPLLQWTYPQEEMIKQDLPEEPTKEIVTDEFSPSYRILVPVANPKTQKGLLSLALEIAGDVPAVVHPMSLVEIDEESIRQNFPDHVESMLQERREHLQQLSESLENDPATRRLKPIVRISRDVAYDTAQIALEDNANLILLGWHRPAFSDNLLGGRVGKILNNSQVDVAVFIDKGKAQHQTILAAYASNMHDDLGLSLALRMLFNDPNRYLKILRCDQPEDCSPDLSYEFRSMMDLLPPQVSTRIEIDCLSDPDPIKVVIEKSYDFDLTIAGTSSTWGIERQTLGKYTDELARECNSSLLITRRYSRVVSHITSLFDKNIPLNS